MILTSKVWLQSAILILLLWLFLRAWNPIAPSFKTHYSQRLAVTELIKLGKLSTTSVSMNEQEQITYSQVLLPKEYQKLSIKDIKVAQQDNIWEIAFTIDSWDFGDGSRYFVYRSDNGLSQKTQLTANDFLLFSGGNYFEVKKLDSNWYEIIEDW